MATPFYPIGKSFGHQNSCIICDIYHVSSTTLYRKWSLRMSVYIPPDSSNIRVVAGHPHDCCLIRSHVSSLFDGESPIDCCVKHLKSQNIQVNSLHLLVITEPKTQVPYARTAAPVSRASRPAWNRSTRRLQVPPPQDGMNWGCHHSFDPHQLDAWIIGTISTKKKKCSNVVKSTAF